MAEAARWFHVRPSTVRMWASAGRLEYAGMQGKAKTYTFTSLVEAERATRNAPTQPGRARESVSTRNNPRHQMVWLHGELVTQEYANLVRAIVDQAPKLSDTQRARLGRILQTVRRPEDAG